MDMITNTILEWLLIAVLSLMSVILFIYVTCLITDIIDSYKAKRKNK